MHGVIREGEFRMCADMGDLDVAATLEQLDRERPVDRSINGDSNSEYDLLIQQRLEDPDRWSILRHSERDDCGKTSPRSQLPPANRAARPA